MYQCQRLLDYKRLLANEIPAAVHSHTAATCKGRQEWRNGCQRRGGFITDCNKNAVRAKLLPLFGQQPPDFIINGFAPDHDLLRFGHPPTDCGEHLGRNRRLQF